MAYQSKHSGTTIDTNIDTVPDLQTQINELNTLINSLNSSISTINTNITNLQSKDTSLTDSINTINSNIAALDNKIIPITQGGSGKTTRLDSMNVFNGNYYRETWALGSAVSGTQTKTISFTSYGRPVILMFSTCIQGGNASGTNCWITAEFHRDGIALKSNTQVVSGSNNDCATLVYLDIVDAGTHTYTVKIQTGAGSIQYDEINLSQPNTQPEIIIFEI